MNSEKNMREIADTVRLFRCEGDVAEVRILNTKKGTVSGYFDDPDKLARSVADWVGKHDIYFSLNPVRKALLARGKNRLVEFARQTTSDRDIECIEFVLVDLDPVRPAGISSTDGEHEASKAVAEEIMAFLKGRGFPEPVFADSGNGYHLLLYTDLGNTEESVALVKGFLAALDFLFSTKEVKVDAGTFNPARIVKLYGTVACKGDDTEERPHRRSRVVSAPGELVPVPGGLLEEVAALLPAAAGTEGTAPQKGLDVEAWLREKGLEVACSAPFHGKGTKHILKACPWNPDHVNLSAYVIRFEGGGVAAGCLHDSCRGQNWESLRDRVEPGWREAESGGAKEKQADVIVRLASAARYLTDDLEQPHAAVDMGGHTEVLPVASSKFRLYLTKLYFDETGSAPGTDAMGQAMKVLEMKAVFSGEQRRLYRRVAEHKGSFYYDLADGAWRAVRVTGEGCTVEDRPPVIFTRNKNMKEQAVPDLEADPAELPGLVAKHFRFRKPQDRILFTVYLASCFVPEIAHVILVLFGEKGAAKSTTMRMAKRIVDPAVQDLLSMPTSKQDLAIVLANTYMPSFDNLESISAEKSDMLCMAATGGAFSKRTLYTDSEETILKFRRCVGLNGINVVATRPDLLDRSIVLELQRVPKNERKTDARVWQDFEADLPRILGATLKAVSRAMSARGGVELREVGRMADFTHWGYAIAEAVGIGGESFIEAYLGNQDRANEEAVYSHPVAAAVASLMKSRESWVSSVSALLKELESLAEEERINTRVKTWPRDSYVLSKRLKEVKSNLEEIGIFFDIRHAGAFKKITIEKKVEDGGLARSEEIEAPRQPRKAKGEPQKAGPARADQSRLLEQAIRAGQLIRPKEA